MEKNMTLEEVRCQIDSIDAEIRELIMKRLDCSRNVAMVKQASGNLVIYRAEREAEILERLSLGVPDDRKAEYLAVVKKIMETSRMYQYGLLYDWNRTILRTFRGNRHSRRSFPYPLYSHQTESAKLDGPDSLNDRRLWMQYGVHGTHQRG